MENELSGYLERRSSASIYQSSPSSSTTSSVHKFPSSLSSSYLPFEKTKTGRLKDKKTQTGFLNSQLSRSCSRPSESPISSFSPLFWTQRRSRKISYFAGPSPQPSIVKKIRSSSDLKISPQEDKKFYLTTFIPIFPMNPLLILTLFSCPW